MGPRPAVWGALAVFLSLGLSCAAPPPAPAGGAQPASVAPAAPKAPPAPVGEGALLVVDISGSMQGFAAKSSKASGPLHDLYAAIGTSLGRAKWLDPYQHCLLGETLDCGAPRPPIDYDRAGLYTGAESRLHVPLQYPPPQTLEETEPPKDEIAPYRTVIMVTDGMQAADTGGAPIYKPDGQPLCNGGSSPLCLGTLLAERADEGWGVWFVRLRLPFDGVHYTERAPSADRRQAAEDRILELRTEYGADFAAIGRETRGRDGTARFAYKGYKLLLVAVLSRDIAGGRAFVEDLRGSLESGITAKVGADAIVATELAPLPPPGWRLTDAQQNPGNDIRAVSVVNSRQPAYQQVAISCHDKKGTGDFRIGLQGTQAGGFLTATPTLREKDSTIRAGGVSAWSPVDGDKWVASVNCLQVSSGKSQARLELRAKWVVSGSPWWTVDHADDGYAPDRLSGLADLVGTVLKRSMKKETLVDRLVVSVDR